MRKKSISTSSVLSIMVLSCAPAAIGQCNPVLQSGGPIAMLRGRVRASVLWDPDGTGPLPQWLVVGGSDLTAGDQSTPGEVIAYDGSQWHGLGLGLSSNVRALAVFNGELIAGGAFVGNVGTGIANRIARFDGTAWHPLGAGTNSVVTSLTVYGGNLIAGGAFGSAGALTAPGVARWNGVNWSALPQSPLAVGATVDALVVFGGSLYVGGIFQTGVGTNLLRWNGTTWFAAGNPGSGFIPRVTALTGFTGTTQGSSFLVAAGSFSTIGGVAVINVAKANSGATTWSAMGGGLPAGASGLLARAPFLGNPEVIATTGGVNPASLVLSWTGSAWVPLGTLGSSSPSGFATAPAFYGGYVVGLNNATGSLRTPSMFRYGNDWTPLLGTGIPAPVQCLACDGADAIAGGAFRTIDNTTVNGIARRTGSTWTAMGSGVAGGSATVKAVARAGSGVVFAGGDFTTAGGTAASNIARWNGSAWTPLGTGTNGTVLALLVAANGDVIAGGDFTVAGGVACNRVARWDGSAWSPLASGADNTVRCLAALANGDLVAGGTFVSVGGVTCNRVARWNGFSWSAMAGGMDGAVHALAALPDGDVVAGGAFTAAGGNPSSRLARFSGSAWLALGPGVPDTVDALVALPDGDVLVGGVFAAGASSHLARWDALTDTIGAVGSGIDGASVLAFATAPNGDVFLGGDFDAILPNTAAGHLAILTTPCPASATPIATACVGPAGPVALTADTLPWMGSTFRSTATGFAPQALAASVLGLAAINLPLSQVLPVGLPNCDLLAATDAVLLMVPQAGTSHYQLTLPDSPVFAGVPLSHQFVQLVISPSGTITSLSSSNALRLVLGAF